MAKEGGQGETLPSTLTKQDRPDVLGGVVVKVKTSCGNLYCQLTWHHGRLFEVFANLGKSGGCASCQTQAITRLVTSSLRSGMPVEECISQLQGLQCPQPIMFPKSNRVLSCPDAIAKVMIKYGSLPTNRVLELVKEAINSSVDERRNDESELEDVKKRTEELRLERERIENEIGDEIGNENDNPN